MDNNDSSNKIESERHIPTVDSDSVSKAVERSSRDNFISIAVEQLRGIKVSSIWISNYRIFKKEFCE